MIEDDDLLAFGDEEFDNVFMPDYGFDELPFEPEYDFDVDTDDWGYMPCVVCGDAADTLDGLCVDCYEDVERTIDRHALRRQERRERAIHGMQVSGRSTKTVLLPTIGKRAVEPRRRERRRDAR